jgi:hypothetical protein
MKVFAASDDEQLNSDDPTIVVSADDDPLVEDDPVIGDDDLVTGDDDPVAGDDDLMTGDEPLVEEEPVAMPAVAAAAEADVPARLIDSSITGMRLSIEVEFGPAYQIKAGDTIVVKLTPSSSDLIKISGLAYNGPIFDEFNNVIGERVFSYDDIEKVYFITVTFNNFFMDEELINITGSYKAYANVQNTGNEPGTIDVELDDEIITVTIPPGGGDNKDFYPGESFSKHGIYGNGEKDPILGGDYTKMDRMRWYLPIGMLNLTNRDLRASKGQEHYTTPDSLKYSNDYPPPDKRYDTSDEPYLLYWYYDDKGVQHFYGVDEPYHYDNVFLNDYLDIAGYDISPYSPHEYYEDSIRIVRIIGRYATSKDDFQYIADSNFLKATNGVNLEEIYRYLGPPPQSPFPGYRGLTIEEFFDRMQIEGQFDGYDNWRKILKFDWVDNGRTPSVQIPHFELELGDLHFSDTYEYSVLGRRLNKLANPWRVIDWPFDDTYVPAKNLPYAYLIYYDTKATDIMLDDDNNFRYNNRAKISFKDDPVSDPIVIAYDLSTATGEKPVSLRLKKIYEGGTADPEITFKLYGVLAGDKIYSQERTINANGGTATFIIDSAGEYTLTETTSSGLGEIDPITFTVTPAMLNRTTGTGKIDITKFLSDSYENIDDIEYDEDTNIHTIVNYPQPVEAPLTGQKTVSGFKQTSDITTNQFSFILSIVDNPGGGCTTVFPITVSAAAGTGVFNFGSLKFEKSGIYIFNVEEVMPNTLPAGWIYEDRKSVV